MATLIAGPSGKPMPRSSFAINFNRPIFLVFSKVKGKGWKVKRIRR
jgi:hypothetical protein